MFLRSLIGPWVLALVRHLEAWAGLAGEDVRDAAAHLARRLVAILIAGVCALASFLMLCAFLVILAWDTPWRNWVAGGLVLAFATAAVALAWPAFRGGATPDEGFFARIRTELGRDRELLERRLKSRPRDSGDGERASD